ncbi:MAG TPA: membrane protein insertase YidC [Proteobacteria bacterium]|nr:membrane protein insertase YidC [Pseudomonadota bacterium]
MDRNALIALVLMLIVWLIWSSLFAPKKPVQPQQEATGAAHEESVETQAEGEQKARQEAAAPEPAREQQKIVEPAAAPAVAGQQAEQVVGESALDYSNGKVRFTLSNIGPALSSWQLLEYRAVLDKPDPVEMIPELPEPSLLIWFDSGAHGYKPVAFEIESDAPPFRLTRQLGNIAVSHELVPDRDYSLKWTVEIANLTDEPVSGRIRVRLLDVVPKVARRGCGFYGRDLNQKRVVAYYKKAFKKWYLYKAAGFKQPLVFGDSVFWVGFDTNYFLTAVMSPVPERTSARLAPLVAGDLKLVESVMELPERTIEPRAVYSESLRLFLGPKKAEVLAEYKDERLNRSLTSGWLGAIAEGLMWILRFFYKLTHNYGVAIILLAVVLKVALYPLTRSSYESMKKMQKLQPQIQELKKKYGKDKERMNRELMRLYKEHKVNPMGGCFPLLLQFPIFIALYRALLYSIELRHAPFVLWIKDLAAPDPYMITPVLMGVAMFASQKLTGTEGADPTQKFMGVFMSIFLVFIFMSLPSGLVIYWLVYNILTIVHQLIKKPEKAAVATVPAGSVKKGGDRDVGNHRGRG